LNIPSGRAHYRGLKMIYKAILLALFSAFIGSLGQLGFKLGSGSFALEPKLLATNYFFLAGISLYAISTIIYMFALRQGHLSVIYPVIATSYIWVTLLSKIILDEPMNIANFAGIALILIGVTIIAWR
jgi:drug/metabolite transporter (DMT)-like permease